MFVDVFDRGNYFVSLCLMWDKSVGDWVNEWWYLMMLVELKSGWLVWNNFNWEWLSISEFVVRWFCGEEGDM